MPPKSRICRAATSDVVGIQHRRRPRRARAAVCAIAFAFVAVRAHADRERLHAPQHEVAVERRRHRAHRVLQEPHLVGPLGVVERDEPADDVGVAAEVLRRRVHDDVGAERERLLQVRRRERVVDDDARVALVRELRDRLDVDDRQHRVGRRLDPHQPGLGRATRPRARRDRAGRTRSTRCRAARARARSSRNVPPYASLPMIDVVAGVERAQDRVLGREAAREPEAVRARLRATRRTSPSRCASDCRCARTRSRGACRPRPARTSSRA